MQRTPARPPVTLSLRVPGVFILSTPRTPGMGPAYKDVGIDVAHTCHELVARGAENLLSELSNLPAYHLSVLWDLFTTIDRAALDSGYLDTLLARIEYNRTSPVPYTVTPEGRRALAEAKADQAHDMAEHDAP